MEVAQQQGMEIEVVKATDLDTIEKYKGEVNIADNMSVISFGASAQKKVGEVSARMLEGVRAKDAGDVGGDLVKMVSAMRGLDFDKVKPGEDVGFFGKLMGKISPLAEFLQSYEEVTGIIEATRNKLELDKVELLKSVKNLDALYATTLDYYHDLGNYITAGEEILKRLDAVDIPAQKEKAAAAGADMIESQNLQDLVNRRDAFERRLHDLKLTRTVVMQQLPSVRMVQNNDNDLIYKIDSQIVNALPSWETGLAIAVEQWKTAKVTKDTKEVDDFTNSMLEKNAEALRMGNAETRRQIERGIYDIESVKKANASMIAAIDESVAIAAEGKAKRAEAEVELQKAEADLKAALQRAAQA